MPTPNTAAQGSLYQHLRSQLAALKLHDAAEALHSVLHQAAGDLSTDLQTACRMLIKTCLAQRLRRRPHGRCRPQDDRLASDLPIPGVSDECAFHQPARCREDLSIGRARASRRSCRVANMFHYRRRSRRPLPTKRSKAGGLRRSVLYAHPTLLVVDELGYLPLRGEAVPALFQVVPQRMWRPRSSCQPPWCRISGEVLGDNTVAAAMLYRLLHRPVALNLNGNAYLLREHNARSKKLRPATTDTRQQLQ